MDASDDMTGSPTEPLDLAAIQRQHTPANGTGLVMELLTLLRETRAALMELAWSMGKLSTHRMGCIVLVQSDAACTCGLEQLKRAANVLALARDEEAPRDAQPKPE